MSSQPTLPEIVLHVAGRSDIGLVREHNEDSFVVVDLTTGETLDVSTMRSFVLGPAGVVMLVCDGMGGAAAGEIASAMAVETVREEMLKVPIDGGRESEEELKESFARRLRAAAYEANGRIYEAARLDPDKIGMGTTMTAVGIIRSHLVIAQVGDSRAYLLRERVLTQVTRDQSLLNELLDSGQISEEQAHLFEHSNVILQALGVQPDVEVLLSCVDLRADDRLVVCSDGLTSVVADEELGALALASDDVAEDCRLLVDMARGAGGPDNITAIVARFEGPGLDRPSDRDPPVRYERWYLDGENGAAFDLSRTQPVPVPRLKMESFILPPDHPKQDFAQTFFSTMLLFAMFIGSLIVGSLWRRHEDGEPCRVLGDVGLSIHVDGYDTGARTRPGGTELRLPLGRHRIRLFGGSLTPAPVSVVEESVTVMPGGACIARFGSAP